MAEHTLAGKRVVRIDSLDKATGQARYTADLTLPRMLYGKVLRSPHAHAKILHVDTSKAEKLRGVVAVVTGKDTAGERWGVFRYTRDQQLFPADKVRYVGEDVAAVAAEDEETAMEALASRKQIVQSSGESSRSRRIPASTALPLAKRLAAAAWLPKKMPRRLAGMILPIMLCQAVAAKPPPRPCQVNRPKVSHSATSRLNTGVNQATAASPRKGRRSWIVIRITVGL